MISMKVIIGSHIYQMTQKQAKKLLMVAGKQIESGIYAIEKDGVIDLKKEKYKTDTGLQAALKKYRSQGFKVHYNNIK